MKGKDRVERVAIRIIRRLMESPANWGALMSSLGVSKATLYRALKLLETDGIIVKGGDGLWYLTFKYDVDKTEYIYKMEHTRRLVETVEDALGLNQEYIDILRGEVIRPRGIPLNLAEFLKNLMQGVPEVKFFMQHINLEYPELYQLLNKGVDPSDIKKWRRMVELFTMVLERHKIRPFRGYCDACR